MIEKETAIRMVQNELGGDYKAVVCKENKNMWFIEFMPKDWRKGLLCDGGVIFAVNKETADMRQLLIPEELGLIKKAKTVEKFY